MKVIFFLFSFTLRRVFISVCTTINTGTYPRHLVCYFFCMNYFGRHILNQKGVYYYNILFSFIHQLYSISVYLFMFRH